MVDEIVIYEITQEVLVGDNRVIVDYTMDKGGKYEYRDALHFTKEQWAAWTTEADEPYITKCVLEILGLTAA